ncbi:MAG: hypothetical protein IT583_04220 [Verrucomicrobia bacterium]|nr:hypothetical protein [Verrucomicrobiota bacterium]
MEVTPELRKGKEVGLIDLTLKPRVMDLIGYDSYQLTPADASMIVWARTYAQANRIGGRYPVLSQLADGSANAVGAIYNPIVTALYTTASNINDNASILQDNPATNSNYRYYGPGNYGFGENSRKAIPSVDGIKVPQVNGKLPYFRLREMSTQVTVADGSTIGMGGLIFDKLETYKDKVPVLGSIPLIGRLFRSEGERSVKRNLMIFVTATEVDVNGRRASDLAMKK